MKIRFLVILFGLVTLLSILSPAADAALRSIRPRPQQMGMISPAPAQIPGSIYLVTPDSPTAAETSARNAVITTLLVNGHINANPISYSQYTGQSPSLWMGTAARFPALATALTATGIPGLGATTHNEEYQLYVDTTRILLMGQDMAGLRWGALSLVDLIGQVQGQFYVDRAYIRDWPDYPDRVAVVNADCASSWEYQCATAQVDSSYQAKFSHIEWNDTDAGTIANRVYLTNGQLLVQRIRNYGMKLFMAADALGHNAPTQLSWQEAVPTLGTKMKVTGTSLTVLSPGPTVPNGGFETWTNGFFSSWSMQSPDRNSYVVRDPLIKHSGSYSAKYVNLDSWTEAGGLDLRVLVAVQPYHLYTMTMWYKTSANTGSLLGLVYSMPERGVMENRVFSAPASVDWTSFSFPLSSYYADSFEIRIGPRYNMGGTVWFDDITLTTTAPQEMVRRVDTPVMIYKEPQHNLLTEGVDFRIVETCSTSFDQYVKAPRIDRIAGGVLSLNDTVSMNWSTAIQYEGGRQTNCFSGTPGLEYLEIYQQKIRNIDSVFAPDGYKIHPNELSLSNYDTPCTSRHTTPAHLFGDFCHQMYNIIQARAPGKPVRIYGDDFDPNAEGTAWSRANNGTLVGSLLELPAPIEMMAMLSYTRNLDSTCRYFDRYNHPIVIAGGIVSSSEQQFLNGMLTAQNYDCTRGIDYYFWQGQQVGYEYKIMEIGSMGWNLGPYLIHNPIGTNSIRDSVVITAEIWSDSFRIPAAATINQATLYYRYVPGSATWLSMPMRSTGTDLYSGSIPVTSQTTTSVQYYISATDNRAQTQKAPTDGPTRYFTARLPAGSSSSLPSNVQRVTYTVADMGDSYSLLQWSPLSRVDCYEVHRGAIPDFTEASQTLVMREQPCCPRLLVQRNNRDNLQVFAIFPRSITKGIR